MLTVLLGIILSYIGNGCKDHWIVFVRSLQLILNLPMIKIAFPSINMNIMSMLFSIASYDLLGYFDIWHNSYFSFLKFKNVNVPFFTQQMQLISFN